MTLPVYESRTLQHLLDDPSQHEALMAWLRPFEVTRDVTAVANVMLEAVMAQRFDIVQRFRDRGYGLQHYRSDTSRDGTAWHAVAQRAQEDSMFDLQRGFAGLVQAGLDPNAPDDQGRVYGHFEHEEAAALQAWLAVGGNIRARTPQGMPVSHALFVDQSFRPSHRFDRAGERLEVLLAHDTEAVVQDTDASGRTLLAVWAERFALDEVHMDLPDLMDRLQVLTPTFGPDEETPWALELFRKPLPTGVMGSAATARLEAIVWWIAHYKDAHAVWLASHPDVAREGLNALQKWQPFMDPATLASDRVAMLRTWLVQPVMADGTPMAPAAKAAARQRF